MIRIAVCDDEQHVLDEISQMTATYMRNCNFNFQIDTFCSGEELLMEIDQSGMYQIVFLDIELTEMNGIRVAVQLRKQYPSMLLVFVSGYSEYYRAAFDVQPFQFLDKPVNEQTFLPLLDRIICHVRKISGGAPAAFCPDPQILSGQYQSYQGASILRSYHE